MATEYGKSIRAVLGLRQVKQRATGGPPSLYAHAVPPFGVLAGQPESQGPDVPAGRGRPVSPRMDLAPQRRTMSQCQRRIVSGVTAAADPGAAPSVSRPAGSRAGPGPRSSVSGGAAAAVPVRRTGGAGSRSLRSATPPHAGTAAAMRPPA